MIEHLASLPRCRARSTRSCSISAPTASPRSPAAPGASSKAGRRRRRASPSRAAPARPISPRRRPSWTTRSASWCSPTPAAPGAATTPISRAKNQRQRVHYLLEAGWKADTAIQGLGRTNRTNQAQPPLFRPIATDVKAEKRFLSTIARRLDSLGAITKGQRQTGGQGLFRAEDNLEAGMRARLCASSTSCSIRGKVEGCSLQRFDDVTGLPLTDHDGTCARTCRRSDLPQSAAGTDHRPAEHALRVFRGAPRGQDRRRHRLGHLRYRRGDHHGREPHRSPSGATSTPIRVHGAETQVFTIARRDRNGPLRSKMPSTVRTIAAAGCWSMASRTRCC